MTIQKVKKELGLSDADIAEFFKYANANSYANSARKEKLDHGIIKMFLKCKEHFEQLSRLLAYSDKYEISIQFWPKQIAVYIAKDGVDLQDYGGDFNFVIGRSIEYLDRVTGKYR